MTFQEIMSKLDQNKQANLDLNTEGSQITNEIMKMLKSQASDSEKREFLMSKSRVQDEIAKKRRDLLQEREWLERELSILQSVPR